jgi:hypothetical protein
LIRPSETNGRRSLLSCTPWSTQSWTSRPTHRRIFSPSSNP